jgi:hypothetical protein
MSVEGATDGAAFETYVEHFLVPTLEEGQVVVMDKTSRGSQEHEGQAPHRGRRSADPFPAALLAGLLAHRGGLLEGEEHPS